MQRRVIFVWIVDKVLLKRADSSEAESGKVETESTHEASGSAIAVLKRVGRHELIVDNARFDERMVI